MHVGTSQQGPKKITAESTAESTAEVSSERPEPVMATRKRSLGILGFGSFGRFSAKHLCEHFDVSVADRSIPEDLEGLPVAAVSLAAAASCEVVVVAVPVQDMEELLGEVSAHLRPEALVVEVASVKEKPAEILDRMLPDGVRFLGLHPMFGPQSGKDGIEGLKVVVTTPTASQHCATADEVQCVIDFLGELNLEVLPMEAQKHDREMAYVQGLPHWIAKALREIHLPDLELATPAYRHLLRIEEILREDSMELFLTIQRENQFTETARKELTERLTQIEELIRK